MPSEEFKDALFYVASLMLVSLLVFAAVFAVNHVVASNVDRSLKFSQEEYLVKYNYLQKHSSEYDTMFFGSSRILWQVDPLIYNQLTGKKSFNAGVSALNAPRSLFLIEKLLKEGLLDSVKTIYLELTPYESFEAQTDHESYYLVTDMHYEYERFLARKIYCPVEWQLSLVKYYMVNLYYSLTKSFKALFTFDQKISYDFSENHGFLDIYEFSSILGLREKMKEYKRQKFIENKDVEEPKAISQEAIEQRILDDIKTERSPIETYPRNDNLVEESEWIINDYSNYFSDLIKKIKALDKEVIFMIAPGVNPKDAIRENILVLKENQDSKLMNFADGSLSREVLKEKYSFNSNHLNPEGAKLLTRVIAREYLKPR